MNIGILLSTQVTKEDVLKDQWVKKAMSMEEEKQKVLDRLDNPRTAQPWDVPMFEIEGEQEVEEDRKLGHLEEMQRQVYETNVANGWFDSDRPFEADIALLHSEVSEALEAYRDHGLEDVTTWPDTPVSLILDGAAARPAKNRDQMREEYIASLKSEGKLPKPEGVGSELADVLVRLLDTCFRYNIDLQFEFDRKCQYNATRGYRHGGKRV